MTNSLHGGPVGNEDEPLSGLPRVTSARSIGGRGSAGIGERYFPGPAPSEARWISGIRSASKPTSERSASLPTGSDTRFLLSGPEPAPRYPRAAMVAMGPVRPAAPRPGPAAGSGLRAHIRAHPLAVHHRRR